MAEPSSLVKFIISAQAFIDATYVCDLPDNEDSDSFGLELVGESGEPNSGKAYIMAHMSGVTARYQMQLISYGYSSTFVALQYLSAVIAQVLKLVRDAILTVLNICLLLLALCSADTNVIKIVGLHVLVGIIRLLTDVLNTVPVSIVSLVIRGINTFSYNEKIRKEVTSKIENRSSEESHCKSIFLDIKLEPPSKEDKEALINKKVSELAKQDAQAIRAIWTFFPTIDKAEQARDRLCSDFKLTV